MVTICFCGIDQSQGAEMECAGGTGSAHTAAFCPVIYTFRASLFRFLVADNPALSMKSVPTIAKSDVRRVYPESEMLVTITVGLLPAAIGLRLSATNQTLVRSA
jgi:hypothetical protein